MKTTTTCVLGLLTSVFMTACGTVEITKTGRGFNNPTNPNTVEILMTVPQRTYQELGTFQASGFMRTETAVMHNAIRTKAAELGADAALITDTGLAPTRAHGTPLLFANGVALKFK